MGIDGKVQRRSEQDLERGRRPRPAVQDPRQGRQVKIDAFSLFINTVTRALLRLHGSGKDIYSFTAAHTPFKTASWKCWESIGIAPWQWLQTTRLQSGQRGRAYPSLQKRPEFHQTSCHPHIYRTILYTLPVSCGPSQGQETRYKVFQASEVFRSEGNE